MSFPKIMARDSGGKEFKKLPPGAHFAICNMLVDCGLQPGFSGKPQRKVYLRWEAPDERVEWHDKEGKEHEGPCAIGRFYTLSLSEKAALRKDLENWRGRTFTDEELKGFDIATILGKCCQIMVTHAESGGKTYANITGIMGLSKDQRVRANTAKAENPLLAYSVESHDPAIFAQLPEWIQKKINEQLNDEDAPEPVASSNGADDFDDDIPF